MTTRDPHALGSPRWVGDETVESNDATFPFEDCGKVLDVTFPWRTPSGRCERGGVPWGAPSDTGGARELVALARPLLERLQRAHRDGELTAEGLEALEQLERFYTALLRQLDARPR